MDWVQLMNQMRILNPNRLQFTDELRQAYNQAALARNAAVPEILGSDRAYSLGIVNDALPASGLWMRASQPQFPTPAQNPWMVGPTQNLGFPNAPMINPQDQVNRSIQAKRVSG